MITFSPHPTDKEGVIALIGPRAIGTILPVKRGAQSWWEWRITVSASEIGTFTRPIYGTAATIAGAKASLTGRWGWLQRHQQQTSQVV